MYIGLSEKVRLVDRLTAQKYGTDGLTLMHNAASAVFEILSRQDLSQKKICILCGKGNNAGDGFALAAMLGKCALDVTLVLLCGNSFSPDAQYYFRQCPQNVKIIENSFVDADIYVDAVFGTGFVGDLPDHISKIFEKANVTDAFKIAIDIPSGINADTGECSVHAFRADITVTFEILKIAHVLPTSRDFCGKVEVMDIGLSKDAMDEAGFDMQLLNGYSLPTKNACLHKGSNGTLFSIVGCRKYQGAATLSLRASLRGGCGIVAAFVPESIYVPLACKLDSAIIHACSENEQGMHASKTINTVSDELAKRIPDAILAGSGMGVQYATREIIEFVLQQQCPCVIDGDGLRYVSGELLKERGQGTVLTPHLGEFARMVHSDVPTVMRDRFALSRKYAQDKNCILVLKDSVTVIATPDGKQWVLSSPNAGMAKGGSGDVLAGLIASFLAQGFSPEEAVKAGLWYHSAAGICALERKGEYAMLPSDVIDELSNVIRP